MQPVPEEVVVKDLLEKVTSKTAKCNALNPQHTYIATITEIDQDNLLWIDIPDSKHLVSALASTPIFDSDIGKQCVITFIEQDLSKPLVTGLIYEPNQTPKHLNLKAEKKLTLECGNSRISLDEFGRVSISGESISSRSYGANRIKGGSIKLN